MKWQLKVEKIASNSIVKPIQLLQLNFGLDRKEDIVKQKVMMEGILDMREAGLEEASGGLKIGLGFLNPKCWQEVFLLLYQPGTGLTGCDLSFYQ